MSARDDYKLVHDRERFDTHAGWAAGAQFTAALDEINALRAEVAGLRVRTLTAEQDADRLARWIKEAPWCPGGCTCDRPAVLGAHQSAVDARVAGETGDTP